jgi:hypothetical protein
MTTAEVRVDRDPALALVVRIFVGAVAERSGVSDDVLDDLRLAASELFAASVEGGGGGPATLRVSTDEGSLSVTAEATDPTGSTEELPGGRFGLIRALFPDAEIGDHVVIRVPTPS